eukprot:SAG31_NODE_4867_length_2899_cov_1.889643_4_plen_45_part_00
MFWWVEAEILKNAAGAGGEQSQRVSRRFRLDRPARSRCSRLRST